MCIRDRSTLPCRPAEVLVDRQPWPSGCCHVWDFIRAWPATARPARYPGRTSSASASASTLPEESGELLAELIGAPVSQGSLAGWYADAATALALSLIHISEPTRLLSISYAVF